MYLYLFADYLSPLFKKEKEKKIDRLIETIYYNIAKRTKFGLAS